MEIDFVSRKVAHQSDMLENWEHYPDEVMRTKPYLMHLSDYERYILAKKATLKLLSDEEKIIFTNIIHIEVGIKMWLGYDMPFKFRHLFRRVVWFLIGRYVVDNVRWLPGYPGQGSKIGYQLKENA